MTDHRIGDALTPPMSRNVFTATANRITENVEKVIDGKTGVVRLALAVLLAEGHLLVEDVPGVGKTTLAKALARSVDSTVRRIQFTADLLPADVTGVSVYNPQTLEFTYKPGAVFANIVVGDEINRASPKTQSALLECMEEHQVTVDGVSYPLGRPFMVFATQNPVEMEGTYPLPEAQRDRFTARIAMGYPDPTAELAMIDSHGGDDPLERLGPICDAATIVSMIHVVRAVHIADGVKQYALRLITATRRCPQLRLGASPRATLHLLRTARAVAALDGRDFVLPDDVRALAVPVLAHRVIPTMEAQLASYTADMIISELVNTLAITDRHEGPPRPGAGHAIGVRRIVDQRRPSADDPMIAVARGRGPADHGS